MTDTIVDQSFRPFILIDQAILDIPLTTDAFRVYAELKRYANRLGGCFPSYKTLGECFKGSYPTSKDSLLRQKAIAAVKELVQWGLVRKEERRKTDESLTSNQYILTPHTEWKPFDKDNDDKVVVGEDYPLVVPDDKVVVGEDPNKIQLTKTNTEPEQENPPTPLEGGECLQLALVPTEEKAVAKKSKGTEAEAEFFDPLRQLYNERKPATWSKAKPLNQYSKVLPKLKRAYKQHQAETAKVIQQALAFCCHDPWYNKQNFDLDVLLTHLDKYAEKYESMNPDSQHNADTGQIGVLDPTTGQYTTDPNEINILKGMGLVS